MTCTICLLNMWKWHKNSFVKAVWGVKISTKTSGFLIGRGLKYWLACERPEMMLIPIVYIVMINSSMTVVGHDQWHKKGNLKIVLHVGLRQQNLAWSNGAMFTCYHAHIFVIFIFASSVQFAKFVKIFHHEHFLAYNMWTSVIIKYKP